MILTCPNCHSAVPGSEVNVQANIAKCPTCGAVFKPSDVLNSTSATFQSPVAVSATPPPGSRITMDTQAGGVIALDAPRPKLNISHIGIFAFSIFWLGFVAVWTTMTIVMNAGFMPLFSIPFWVVGIYMLVRNFRSIATRQQLVISGHELSLIKIRPGGRKTWAYPLNEVRGAEIQEDVNYTSRRTGSTHRTVHVTKNPYLIIQSGNKKFFESQSQGDKEWIVGFINQFLKTKRG